MLSMLGQDALSRVVFPVGDMTKDEVRAHARRLGLRTAGKPDSQDVCFIGSAEGREGFLSGRVELHPAEVVDGEGRPAGSVDAVELVTVGQRRGMGHGSDGKRRYVTHVDVAARRVTVGSAAEVLRSSVLLAGPSLTWVDRPLAAGARAVAQVSAHGRPVPCTVRRLQAGHRRRRGPLRRPAAARGAGPDGGALRRARPRRRRGRGHRRLTVAGPSQTDAERQSRRRRRPGPPSSGSRSSTTTSCTTCSMRPRSPTPNTTSSSWSCGSSRRTIRRWRPPTRRRTPWARRRRACSKRCATASR